MNMNRHIAFVVSDGTGRTAERALNAALTQFENVDIDVVRCQNVRSQDEVRQVVEEAAAAGAFIIHTLVTDGLRGRMVRLGRQHNVECIDIMGPLLGRLSQRFHVSPAEKPGLFSQLNRDYFRRIESMEFAISHDDGLRSNELKKAEMEAKNLVLNIGFFTPDMIDVFLAKANSEALALAAAVTEKNPDAMPSDVLSQVQTAAASAPAPAPAADTAPAAEEPEEEEEEEAGK